MKLLQLSLVLCGLLLKLVCCEPAPPSSQRPLVFKNWPPKSSNQQSYYAPPQQQQQQKSLYQRSIAPNQKMFVFQIRSENPVPLVFKGGRPGTHGNLQHSASSYAHVHHHLHHHAPQQFYHHYQQERRPIKLTAPAAYLKPSVYPYGRKPLKIKLNNVKAQSSKPSSLYEKPFKYETTMPYTSALEQKLPTTTHANFMSNHFAPIYTIPAPNLALSDNHLHHHHYTDTKTTTKTTKISPITSIKTLGTTASSTSTTTTTRKPQSYTQYKSNHYQVIENETNDHTIHDPLSGSQKLFAPDPDPSLPTSKIRPAKEPFNQPSIGKPLPSDIESDSQPAQPLVQIVGAPEIYPVQYAQPLIAQHNFAAVQPVASIPIYDPTYLVTQSNNLYHQHQQQLFKPNVAETVVANTIDTGYPSVDLTQIVASDGQILQAAKDPHNNIHPVLDAPAQFAALVASPSSLEVQSAVETKPFHLPNVAHHQALSAAGPSNGFVASDYYGPIQDSSQLLQAYAEEEAQREQYEAAANLELQKQQHLLAHEQQQQQQQQQQQLLHQQQQILQHQQLVQQEQQHQALALQQHQHQHQALELQQHQHQVQQPFHHSEPQRLQQQQQVAVDPAAAAFEEHQRLVQQQLGPNTPLRIFVPDEDTNELRSKKKRSEKETEKIDENSKAPSEETEANHKADDDMKADATMQLSKEELKSN